MYFEKFCSIEERMIDETMMMMNSYCCYYYYCCYDDDNRYCYYYYYCSMMNFVRRTLISYRNHLHDEHQNLMLKLDFHY